jgi:hypothetical protein
MLQWKPGPEAEYVHLLLVRERQELLMQDYTKKIREGLLECQEEKRSNSEDFYLDQKYFSKKCVEEMIRRSDDNMLVKNIFFREDGIVESAYADETFGNWGSLNLFLQNHVIDELEEMEVVSTVLPRYPNEEL